jgi:hypothetical protein
MPFAGGSTDLLDAVREREQVVGSVGHRAPPLPRTVTYPYSSEASDVFILGFALWREHADWPGLKAMGFFSEWGMWGRLPRTLAFHALR